MRDKIVYKISIKQQRELPSFLRFTQTTLHRHLQLKLQETNFDNNLEIDNKTYLENFPSNEDLRRL